MNRNKPNPIELPQPGADDKVTLWQTVVSVLAAFFGVQGSASRQRDFTRGKPIVFILVALALTGLFVIGLLTIVRVILHQAAA